MALSWQAIDLGIPTDGSGNTIFLDEDNPGGDMLAENSGDIVGDRFGSSSDPLSNHIVTVTPEDTNGDGGLDPDYYNQVEYINYDLGDGSGPQRVIFDTLVVYRVRVTFDDGSRTNVSGVVIQDWNGRLFLAPELSQNSDFRKLSSKPIRSIQIRRVLSDDGNTLNIDREPDNFICFTAGTRIETANGPLAAEKITQGDLLCTRDHGLQPVIWAGSSTVRFTQENAHLRPVRITAGALGPGVPEHALCVSPNHRVLVCSPIATRICGSSDVLIAAKHLIGAAGIAQENIRDTRYIHLALARHEVLISNGAETESFFPGPEAMKIISARTRMALQKAFPVLATNPGARPLAPARPFVEGRKARALVARHLQNAKRFQDGRSDLSKQAHIT